MVGLHPSVSRVAVVGIPDERWGEIVVAVIVLWPGSVVDETEIINFCRQRLPGHETPKRVIVVDDLPTGFGGKVLKAQLKADMQSRGVSLY